MHQLAATYDFVHVDVIGKSYEGRPLSVLKVCLPNCTAEVQKSQVVGLCTYTTCR